jgi:hypothetical protein
MSGALDKKSAPLFLWLNAGSNEMEIKPKIQTLPKRGGKTAAKGIPLVKLF